MPIVALLAAAFVISLALTGMLLVGTVLLGAGAVAAVVYGVYYLLKTAQEDQKREEEARVAELARLEQEHQRALAIQNHPTEKEFLTKFANAMHVAYPDAAYLPPTILREFLLIARELYQREPPPFDLSILAEALLKAFLVFTQSLPRFAQTQLTVPVAELVDLAWLTKPMIDPFRDPRLANRMAAYIPRMFDENCLKLGRGNAPVYPQDFKSDLSKAQVAHLYLQATPFNQLFQTLVPFGYTDEERFEHQVITSPSGQGKTTYASNLIRADLERVARDEACVVVIDPKGALSQLARYEEFAAGRKLDGRLVYIEPSRSHPLALNPFRLQYDRDDEEQHDAAVSTLTYALGSLFETEPTKLQSGALQYLIHLMLQIPNSTIQTLIDFLTDKNYLKEEYQSVIRRMKDPTRAFLLKEVPQLRDDTKLGIRQRLFILIARPHLARMFCASECRFDMFKETLRGKVIVVDANVGVLSQEPMEVFGRLFISMLLQVARRRINYHGYKPPIFAYVDEAQNFISRDPLTPRLINEVRAQLIGLTFSPQSLSDIEDPKVRAALADRSNIRVRSRKGSARVQVGYEEETKNYNVHVDNFRYHIEPKAAPHAPHMSPLEFEAVKAQMRARYCAAPPPEEVEFEESFDRP